ncbi:unnamed protein product [Caenorhabditis sp. 36 PRJEB53466]|nr:unnamed protein product [Caenorhabditis sp. 36 PRJEB53466]
MIVSVLNSSDDTFWLPFYSLNDEIYEAPFYVLLGLVQLSVYCSTAYTIVRTCSIFLSIRLFHENMNILMAWFLCQWFEAIFAKLIIIPYQAGIIKIGEDPKRSYYSWWSENPADIVVVRSRTEILPLYVACLFMWHYIYSVIFALLVVGCERIFATFYIQDYEKVRRRHIPIGLIVLVNLVTVPYAYQICNNRIPFLVAYVQCFVNAAAIFFGYLIIWRVNVVLRNRMDRRNNLDEYCLARKFQVEENIRSFELAKRVVYVAVIFLSLALVVLSLLVFGLVQGNDPIFVYMLDNAVLSDYEKTPRKHIGIGLLLMVHCISFPFSYLMINNRVHFVIADLLCIVCAMIVAMVYGILWYINEKLNKKFSVPGRYHLAQQFQVKENIRHILVDTIGRCTIRNRLQLARNIVCVATLFVAIACSVLMCIVLDAFPYWLKNPLAHCVENFIFLNPLLICSVMVFSVPAWRKELIGWMPTVAKLHQNGLRPADETEAYFKQFRSAWV